MLRTRFFAMGLVAIFAVCKGNSSLAQTTQPCSEDTQIWTDAQLVWPLSSRLDAIGIGALRMGRNASRPVDERVGFAASIKTDRFFTFTPGYLHIEMQPPCGNGSSENRITLPLDFQITIRNLILGDRSQFEIRFRNPQGTQTRYRNQFQIGHAIRKPRITAFVSDEVFYDWSAEAWIRNRFSIGFTREFTRRVDVDFYYMRQNDGQSQPGNLNVVGTIFRIQLK